MKANQFAGTRQAVEAGRFYPDSPARLAASVADFLADGACPHALPARAIVAPHAGYAYSGPTAGLAYARLEASPGGRIVLLAPSHHVAFPAISTGNQARLATPLGDVNVDTEACADLLANPLFVPRSDTHAEEHAIGTHLPFLAALLPETPVLPLVCGQLGGRAIEQAAERLARAFPEESTRWIVSSDFTHFGPDFDFVPFRDQIHERLEELDRTGIGRILARDGEGFAGFLADTGATICGVEPIRILLGILRRLGIADGELLGYTSSGRLTGDERHSVGYAAIAFGQTAPAGPVVLAPEEKTAALALARAAIAADLFGQDFRLPEELPPVLREEGTCFVSLTVGGRLRGCVGELETDGPLAESIVRNAREAAFGDWRFPPLAAPELPAARIEISILSPLRRIADPADFVPGTHGILLEKGRRNAVFLPQVAPENGWDRETTLEHLCRKASLPANAWRRGPSFKVFTAQEFAEPEAP